MTVGCNHMRWSKDLQPIKSISLEDNDVRFMSFFALSFNKSDHFGIFNGENKSDHRLVHENYSRIQFVAISSWVISVPPFINNLLGPGFQTLLYVINILATE